MLRVLTYHRVAEPERTPLLHPRMVSATPEVFEAHARHLQKRYRVVSLPEVLQAARRGSPLPARAVLVTFDDAYRDFLDAAWPILEERRLPATMFVPTAYAADPERSFWWDRLHRAFAASTCRTLDIAPLGSLPLATPDERRRGLAAAQAHVKRLPHSRGMAFVDQCVAALGDPGGAGRVVLGWDELRDLARRGLSVCAHSRTHPLLTRLAPPEVREEVRGSLLDVRQELGESLPVFAYPSGAVDDPAAAILEEEGVELAFTQVDGHNDLARTPRLRLYRTNITRKTTPAVFQLRLQRWMTWVDRWRHRERPSPAVGRDAAELRYGES